MDEPTWVGGVGSGGELETLHPGRVERAAARREDGDEFAADHRVDDDAAIVLGCRGHHQAQVVGEVGVVDPPGGREALALGHPLQPDVELGPIPLAADPDLLDLAAEDVALDVVLDLDLASDEGGQQFGCQIHGVSPCVGSVSIHFIINGNKSQ